MLHIAAHTDGASADYYLSRILEGAPFSLHPFHTLPELLTLAQRYTLDLVYLGTTRHEEETVMRIVETVRSIKQHTYLAILPTILYHPKPSDNTVVAAYENGAEEVFHEEVPIFISKVKTRMLIERSIRDLSVNPSSRLPGPSMIETEIDRQIDLKQQFAVCYADLDNFKAFNDFYGYYYGDRVIRMTARIIKDVVFDLCHEGFVGHIGGDDFVFIIPPDLVTTICENIIRTFDVMIPYRYKREDRKRGYIDTNSRRGDIERFPIMTISIAVVVNKESTFAHVGEMSHMLADLKKYTKSLEGSNYMVERRQKY